MLLYVLVDIRPQGTVFDHQHRWQEVVSSQQMRENDLYSLRLLRPLRAPSIWWSSTLALAPQILDRAVSYIDRLVMPQ